MHNKNTHKEHRQRIEKVIHFILKNPHGEHSLETLAGVANYSPYYFQKLFKQMMGESPKQYVFKIRLETACHYLIIHAHKSITEIAFECGFSSLATFSRAFKKYFGISAEEMRAVPQNDVLNIRKNAYQIVRMVSHKAKESLSEREIEQEEDNPLKIEVKRLPAFTGVCVNTVFNNIEQIQRSLKEVITLANSHDLFSSNSKIAGIIHPQHNTYRAFVSIENMVSIPVKLNKTTIKSGKYATFKLHGCAHDVFDMVTTTFYESWLPENGYRIAGDSVIEFFMEDPSASYKETEREICIPIEPV